MRFTYMTGVLVNSTVGAVLCVLSLSNGIGWAVERVADLFDMIL